MNGNKKAKVCINGDFMQGIKVGYGFLLALRLTQLCICLWTWHLGFPSSMTYDLITMYYISVALWWYAEVMG